LYQLNRFDHRTFMIVAQQGGLLSGSFARV